MPGSVVIRCVAASNWSAISSSCTMRPSAQPPSVAAHTWRPSGVGTDWPVFSSPPYRPRAEQITMMERVVGTDLVFARGLDE